MKLGAFSISLKVEDLAVSKTFYEKLGFSVLGGDFKQNYLIMKNKIVFVDYFRTLRFKVLRSFIITFLVLQIPIYDTHRSITGTEHGHSFWDIGTHLH